MNTFTQALLDFVRGIHQAHGIMHNIPPSEFVGVVGSAGSDQQSGCDQKE
ncbi:MAG: hypothetical protein GX610_18710 [Rhodococcus sp.]|nr:hypothetical protein [Rhodococcus sp. (in: high G+C Gram-positive bacteria)]